MAAPSYTAAKASTLANDTGGAWSHTTAAPSGAGQLIIVHVFQDGTSASNAITISSATNCTALDGTSNAYTPLSSTGSPVGSTSTPTGYHYVFFARSTGTNTSVITGGNSGTDDIYVRTYQFGGVHTGADLTHILENVIAGRYYEDAATSTSVTDVGVQAMGNDRLALNFIAVADDIQGAELTAMDGETGGDWTYPVAAAGSSTGTDGTLGLVAATLATGGTINGGADAITSEAWGVIGFALRPTDAVLIHYGVTNNPYTVTTVTAGHDIAFAFQWQRDAAGNSVYSDISSATARTYALQPADVTCHIRCKVTATDDAGSTIVYSNVVGPVAASAVTGSVVTALTASVVTQAKVTAKQRVDTQLTAGIVTSGTRGGVKAGQVASPFTATIVTSGRVTAKQRVDLALTATIVTSGLGAITYTYQWQRDVAGNSVYSDIGGQTAATHVLTSADVTCHVRCVVTATDDGGSTPANSNAVGPIAANVVTGQVVTALTAGIVTVAKVTAKQRVDTAVTATIVTAATRVIRGQVATALTANRVTAAKVTAKQRVDTGLTLGTVTNATRALRGKVDSPFTVTPVTVGRVRARGAVATALTYGTVTNGTVGGVKAGSVVTALTANIVTSGRVTAKAATATPLTFGTVTAATRITHGQVAAPFTVNRVTAGRVTHKGRIDLPITVGITTTPAGAITYTYQWQRDTAGNGIYSTIGGQTATTYILQVADVNCHVRCVVTATDDGGSTSANSNAVGPVAAVGATLYGSVVTALAANIVIAAKVTAKQRVDTAFTFGAVTNGQVGAITYAYQWQRDTAGNSVYANIGSATGNTYVLQAADHGCHVRCVVTATDSEGSNDANSNAVGPVTATITGQVATGLTFDAVVNGSVPQTPGMSAAGLIYMFGDFPETAGAVDLPLTLNRVITGRVTAKARVDTQLTAGIVTEGNVAGHREGSIVTALTASITTVGRVTHHGAVVTPLTVDRVTVGRLTARAASVVALAASIVTAATRILRGQVVTPLALDRVTVGRVGAKASTSTVLTFGVVTEGNKAGVHTGRVVTDITTTISTSGRVTAKGSVTSPFTFGTVTSATHVLRGQIAFPLTAGIVTVGKRNVTGQISLPATLNIFTAAGTVMAPGGIVFTATFASTITGRVTARGQVDTTTIFDTQTVGHITALAATTSTYIFTTTTTGRHIRYSSLTLPLHAIIATRGTTSLPGIPIIGQLLHNRIGTLDDPTAGHLEPEEVLA